MAASELDTRRRIVHSADTLFYEQGFEATSFADIAQVVGISRGNFYHYFKTKDQILAEVISLRLAQTRSMLEAWEARSNSPKERLQYFIDMMIINQAKIMLYGCPVGTLCNELAKLDHRAQPDAAGIFSLFRDWLAQQFAACGQTDQAQDFAMHLLSRSQGLATLATAFRDEAFIRREAEDMTLWCEGLLGEKH